MLGDSGEIDAAARSDSRFGNAAITLGVITTALAPELGGPDTITTGSGKDVVIGGVAGDDITAGAGLDLVLGDNARIVLADRAAAVTLPEARIDIVETIAHNDGGADTIRGDAGEDLLVGGSAGDTIDGGSDDDLIFGDTVELQRRVG